MKTSFALSFFALFAGVIAAPAADPALASRQYQLVVSVHSVPDDETVASEEGAVSKREELTQEEKRQYQLVVSVHSVPDDEVAEAQEEEAVTAMAKRGEMTQEEKRQYQLVVSVHSVPDDEVLTGEEATEAS